ncbi:transpeptidase family protein [bacterium]|nr:transpeptidase family protein [bacterium]
MKRLWNKEKQPERSEKRRLILLRTVMTVSIFILLIRFSYIQVWHRRPWLRLTDDLYKSRIQLTAKRGEIFDRKLNVLAADISTVALSADPTRIKDFAQTAAKLAAILGGKAEEYIHLFRHPVSPRYTRIRKSITEPQNRALQKARIEGLIFMEDMMRIHPFADLGFQVLGITDAEHTGVGGIEQVFETVLSGQDGWAYLQKDALNRRFTSADYPKEKPVDGEKLVLTLDYSLQVILEEELRAGMDRHQAKSASGVLMDPFTGEVLAMASVSQGAEKDPMLAMQNQAVQASFEPGSTFKIVTVAAALEERIVEPQTLIHCENGAYVLAGQTIHDHDKSYGLLTVAQIMEQSSNIGVVKIGKKLGKKKFYEYIRSFGFGNCTGIELPGETPGFCRPHYRWDDFTAAAISFGQGLSVSTLQMACMASVIANGGELVRPRIVDSILGSSGNQIRKFPKASIRRVISEQTARTMRTILEGVVERGIAKDAAIVSVPVAGKTGTAEKAVPGFKGYQPGAHVSSFVGFWPSVAPRYVLTVVLNEPRHNYYAAYSAVPVFRRVVERMCHLPEAGWILPRPEDRPQDRSIVLSDLRQEPVPAADPGLRVKGSPHVMPDLRGMSKREAMLELADRNIEVRVSGRGIVVSQSIPPGTRVKDRRTCHLICQ